MTSTRDRFGELVDLDPDDAPAPDAGWTRTPTPTRPAHLDRPVTCRHGAAIDEGCALCVAGRRRLTRAPANFRDLVTAARRTPEDPA